MFSPNGSASPLTQAPIERAIRVIERAELFWSPREISHWFPSSHQFADLAGNRRTPRALVVETRDRSPWPMMAPIATVIHGWVRVRIEQRRLQNALRGKLIWFLSGL